MAMAFQLLKSFAALFKSFFFPLNFVTRESISFAVLIKSPLSPPVHCWEISRALPLRKLVSSSFRESTVTKLTNIACMWLFCRGGRFRFGSFSYRFAGSPFIVLRSVMDKAALFQSIGLSDQKAQETLKNEALSTRLETIINLVRTIHHSD